MIHNRVLGAIGSAASNVFNDSNLGLINALGAAGQIASTERAISRLQDIGAEGKEAIGMPAGDRKSVV